MMTCSDRVGLEAKCSQDATSFVGLSFWLIYLMLVQEEKQKVSRSSLVTISLFHFVHFQPCAVQEASVPLVPQTRLLAMDSNNCYI